MDPLRPDESAEAYGLYVFLNPYRAGLIKTGETWPHWWCPQPDRFAFASGLETDGSPPAEWIEQPVPEDLCLGE